MKKILIIILLIIINILISFIFFIKLINTNKICYGVKIADIDFGGKTISEAQEILKYKWLDFAKQNIKFNHYIDINSNIADFGFQINYEKTISQASNIKKLKQQIFALFNKYNFDIIYDFNEEQFNKNIKKIFINIEQPVQNADLVFDEENNQFIVQESKQGKIINKNKLLENLINNIKKLLNYKINLEIDLISPAIKKSDLESVKQKAQQIIDNNSFKVYSENNTWTIKKSVLASWINFDQKTLNINLDQNKIKTFLEKIALIIDQPMLEAKLEIKDNRAIIMIIPQQGFGLQIDKTLDNLIKNILSDTPVAKTKLSIGVTKPKTNLSETNDLGINELIGQGTSNFAGSPSNRIHNIKTGAEKFNGLILEPNQEFSFNQMLGGSGEEQGFLSELVIKKGELIPEYGGGLCQISTTLFRTALDAGFQITERKPHAFPISYYNPPGFDATIYEPKPDFRFINNSPEHVLIQSIIINNNLTFNFYGTDDNRRVEIIGPEILEQKEDGSIKTILTQEVYQDNKLIQGVNFFSDYDSPDNYEKVEEE